LNEFKDQILSDLKDLIKQELAGLPMKKSMTVGNMRQQSNSRKLPKGHNAKKLDKLGPIVNKQMDYRVAKTMKGVRLRKVRNPDQGDGLALRALSKGNVGVKNSQDNGGDGQDDRSERSIDFAAEAANVPAGDRVPSSSLHNQLTKQSSFQYSTS